MCCTGSMRFMRDCTGPPPAHLDRAISPDGPCGPGGGAGVGRKSRGGGVDDGVRVRQVGPGTSTREAVRGGALQPVRKTASEASMNPRRVAAPSHAGIDSAHTGPVGASDLSDVGSNGWGWVVIGQQSTKKGLETQRREVDIVTPAHGASV